MKLVCILLAACSIALGAVAVGVVILYFPSFGSEIFGAVGGSFATYIIAAPFVFVATGILSLGGMANGGRIELPIWAKLIPLFTIFGVICAFGIWVLATSIRL